MCTSPWLCSHSWWCESCAQQWDGFGKTGAVQCCVTAPWAPPSVEWHQSCDTPQLLFSHSSALQEFSLHIRLWGSTHLPWQAGAAWIHPHEGPVVGRHIFHRPEQGPTLQTHQTIPSQNLWITFLSSFSITLWTDKKPFREILSWCCHFNPTDVKVIFTLFLLS